MKKFDYLEVFGKHEDIGRAIGLKFKFEIQQRIVARKRRIKNYSEYLKKGEPFYHATKEFFPDLIREIEGVAGSAGVGIADYFMVNCREVSSLPKSDHCTIAVTFDKRGAIIGHNEDWNGTAPEALYLLKATVGDTTFFGLQYKAIIPGATAATNNWGLTECINDLNEITQPGVPKHFLARAVLECRSLDEAENLIRKTKKASGFNHLLVQGMEVRNIEVAGDHLSVEKAVGQPYVHTNHFLSPKLKKFETYCTQSSLERYERARQMVIDAKSVIDMENLLSDKTNTDFPILREKATLGSMVFDIGNKKAFIRYGNSSNEDFVGYDL